MVELFGVVVSWVSGIVAVVALTGALAKAATEQRHTFEHAWSRAEIDAHYNVEGR